MIYEWLTLHSCDRMSWCVTAPAKKPKPVAAAKSQQLAKIAVDKIKADESSTDDATAVTTITASASPVSAVSGGSSTSGTPRRKSVLPTSATKKRAPSIVPATAVEDVTVEMQVHDRQRHM